MIDPAVSRIRHWENVSIELECITVLQVKKNREEYIPDTLGSFLHVSSSSCTTIHSDETFVFYNRPVAEGTILLTRSCTPSRALGARVYFFLSTTRNSEVWKILARSGKMGSLWARQIYRRGKAPARWKCSHPRQERSSLLSLAIWEQVVLRRLSSSERLYRVNVVGMEKARFYFNNTIKHHKPENIHQD